MSWQGLVLVLVLVLPGIAICSSRVESSRAVQLSLSPISVSIESQPRAESTSTWDIRWIERWAQSVYFLQGSLFVVAVASVSGRSQIGLPGTTRAASRGAIQ
jgi:hypothetical protein